MKLGFTPEAQQQADECDTWWRENREAPDLFARELAGARVFLREAPNVGAKYTVLDGLPVRRVLLPKTGTHIYYSVDEDADFVTVLAVWGAPKGRGPKLWSSARADAPGREDRHAAGGDDGGCERGRGPPGPSLP